MIVCLVIFFRSVIQTDNTPIKNHNPTSYKVYRNSFHIQGAGTRGKGEKKLLG